SHSQLKTVTVTRSWPHGLGVQIEERTPSLIWKTGDQAYLLDLDGTIISPINPATSKLPLITDTTNLPVKVGEQVVSEHFVSFCTGLVGSLARTTGLKITGRFVVSVISGSLL